MSHEFGALARLKGVLPAPDEPLNSAPTHGWTAVENSMTLHLPSDYKGYLQDYGSGLVNHFIFVFNPFATNPALQLQFSSEEYARIDRQSREEGVLIPFPVFPEPGGLLAWGKTSNGDVLFWQTRPKNQPDSWSVVVSESRGPAWVEHPGPMSAFLADLLTGAISMPFIGPDQIGFQPRFEPFDL